MPVIPADKVRILCASPAFIEKFEAWLDSPEGPYGDGDDVGYDGLGLS